MNAPRLRLEVRLDLLPLPDGSWLLPPWANRRHRFRFWLDYIARPREGDYDGYPTGAASLLAGQPYTFNIYQALEDVNTVLASQRQWVEDAVSRGTLRMQKAAVRGVWTLPNAAGFTAAVRQLAPNRLLTPAAVAAQAAAFQEKGWFPAPTVFAELLLTQNGLPQRDGLQFVDQRYTFRFYAHLFEGMSKVTIPALPPLLDALPPDHNEQRLWLERVLEEVGISAETPYDSIWEFDSLDDWRQLLTQLVDRYLAASSTD